MPPQRILVSGSTGLLGQAIVADRRRRGDTVVPLVRTAGTPGAIVWDPVGPPLDPALVSGFDTVIHLSGEPLAGERWTARKKRRIYASRVEGTQKLASALAAAPHPPGLFLSASGINVYGNRGDDILDESAPPGSGFLPEVCTGWEAAADSLAPLCRVVSLRIGIVLAAQGGTLATMLPIFRLGLGGPVAGGRAWVSWISLRDLVRVVDHVIQSPSLHGPLNVVAPAPITNRQFTAALGRALHRPAILPVPAWLTRALFGELASETVLSSVRAVPHLLLQDGFVFEHASLASAFAACHLAPASQ